MKRRIKKRLANKQDDENFKDIFFEGLNEFILKFFLYAGLSLAVYFTGKFSWWIGFVLFIILAVFILSESLLAAFISFLEIFVSYAAFSVILKYKNKKFDTKDFFSYGSGFAVLSGLFSLSLLILFYQLFVFFFPQVV